MKLKKLYKHDRGRQIFRILPTDSNKLILEERDREKKEAFFSCFDINTGKKLFQDFQLDEKYWIGIQMIYKDIILFHRFERPDLPKHKGIIAFDINTKKVIWENQNSFLFVSDDKAIFFTEQFGIRKYFSIDCLSGKIEEDLTEIEKLTSVIENYDNYQFSKKITQSEFELMIDSKFKKKICNYLIKEDINFVKKDGIIFFSFHIIHKKSKFDNLFFAIDQYGKIILEETLNKGTDKIEPESFFIKDNFLFLLFGSSGFGVYKII